MDPPARRLRAGQMGTQAERRGGRRYDTRSKRRRKRRTRGSRNERSCDGHSRHFNSRRLMARARIWLQLRRASSLPQTRSLSHTPETARTASEFLLSSLRIPLSFTFAAADRTEIHQSDDDSASAHLDAGHTRLFVLARCGAGAAWQRIGVRAKCSCTARFPISPLAPAASLRACGRINTAHSPWRSKRLRPRLYRTDIRCTHMGHDSHLAAATE